MRPIDIDVRVAALAALPRVRSAADVHALPPGTRGVWAVGLDDALLAAIARRLPALRTLAGDGTASVTDAGLAALGALPDLEWLDLEWSRVTDAGLAHVAGLPALRWVDLTGCVGVTEGGLASLRAARPGLTVEPLAATA